MGRVAAAVCVGAILPVLAPPPSQPALLSADDPLWLAVMAGRGHLYPVARLDGESWEVPDWVMPFEVEGVDAPEEAELTPDGDGGWSWSGGLVTRDVPTSWLLYSDEHSGSPLTVTGGRLATAHCVFKWALTVDGPAPDLPEHQFAGVALSREPEAVLFEDDIPVLNRIGEDLDLVDSTADRWSESYRKFRWLAFVRVAGTVIGVVHGEYYEGEAIHVVEIVGDVGRVVAETHMGGC